MSSKMYEIQHGTAPRCQHIFDTNLQCQSPALRGRTFCYWHQQNRKYKEKFTVPLLETAHAIQLTLSRITADLYDGKIDTKRATALYYGLSLAMFNVRNLSNPVSSDHVIDLPAAMIDVLAPTESAPGIVAADLCHPERGRMSEPKDPGAAHTTENVSTLSDDTTTFELSNDGVTQQPAHAACMSGASAPRCEPPQDGALAPVVASAPSSPSRPPHGTDAASMPPGLQRFVKKVLRAGPAHPKFHEVSRIYDRYISADRAG
mgnify:CR=1 FL=1